MAPTTSHELKENVRINRGRILIKCEFFIINFLTKIGLHRCETVMPNEKKFTEFAEKLPSGLLMYFKLRLINLPFTMVRWKKCDSLTGKLNILRKVCFQHFSKHFN